MKRISILLYIVQGNFSVHINILYILSIRVTKAPGASPSYKIADCELSNSYLLTHKIFSSNRFFKFF